LKRERLKANSTEIEKWHRANRKSRRFLAPAVLKNDEGKIAEWIPAHVEALTEILRVIPFPLDALRTLPTKSMLEFGATINSQAQLELIEHHANDEDIPMQARAHCQRWATLVKACHQGPSRWKYTDDPVRWSKLEVFDDDLKTGLTNTQLDQERWAVLNVLSVITPQRFRPHAVAGIVLPDTRAFVYENSPDLQGVVNEVAETRSWALAMPLCEYGQRGVPRRS